MEVENTEKNNFKDYNLKLELLRGLYSLGFEEPTNLQKKVLSSLFSSSKDILVQSPKLTGKKISFIIYSLQNISKEKKRNDPMSNPMSHKRINNQNKKYL